MDMPLRESSTQSPEKILIKVRDVRWTSSAELNLPAWRHAKNWQEGYEKLWLGSKGHEASIITTSDELLSEKTTQMAGIERKCFYIPFDAVQGNTSTAFALADILKFEIPLLESSAKPKPLNNKLMKPCLALTIDYLEDSKKVQNTTIVIPHWESIGFLRLCINSIRHVFAESLMPEVLVIDDNSNEDTWSRVQALAEEFTFNAIQIQRFDQKKVADVGKLLDEAIRVVQTEYICMLDADTLILSKDFLSVPISKLQSYSVVSVGLDTDLADSYHSNRQWLKYGQVDKKRINLPGYNSITNNLYRVMRTLDAQAISIADPFSRRVINRTLRDQFGRLIRKIDTFLHPKFPMKGFSRELIKARILNSSWPSMPPTSDNGVNANYWMDKNNMGLKINIPITSYGFRTPYDGVCFQNISNFLVHIALSTRALSSERREIEDAGEEFYGAVNEIVENQYEYADMSRKVNEISLIHVYE